ncbi:MAG: hypothetical protein PHI35_00690 [Victivallaceae bacterium]|nr:hypothetical protein [Victivallaceae bacterium]
MTTTPERAASDSALDQLNARLGAIVDGPEPVTGPASTDAPENCFLGPTCSTPATNDRRPATSDRAQTTAGRAPSPAPAIALERGLVIATRILNELAPLSARIELAGSGRRRRPFWGDLDFVVIPKDAAAFHDRVMQRCTLAKKADGSNKGDGSEVLIVEMSNGVQLDFYFARASSGDMFRKTPCTWGSVLLHRTGSKAHNVYLAKRALEKGYRWILNSGLYCAGNHVCGSTEEEIFSALDLPFVKPEQREV